MAEGAVHLHRHVESLVAEADIGAQHRLRGSLAADLVHAVGLVIVRAVRGLRQPRAVRHEEHAQRLAHDPGDHVIVSAVETGTVHRVDTLDFRRFQILALPFAGQGYEPVALEGKVHVQVHLHVLVLVQGSAQAQLQAAVGHLAQIGHQRTVGEGRDAHLVLVQHVAGERIVVLRREDDAVVPEARLHTGIDG